jgi:hypothetical protein
MIQRLAPLKRGEETDKLQDKVNEDVDSTAAQDILLCDAGQRH